MDLTDYDEAIKMQRVIRLESPLTPHRCGRPPVLVFDGRGDRYFCECVHCSATTSRFPTQGQAVDAWESIASIGEAA